jgi:hypothetical protein
MRQKEKRHMTATRVVVGFGIGLLALTASAGTYVLAQNTNADPRPFIGRGLGPGGPWVLADEVPADPASADRWVLRVHSACFE